MTQQKLTFPAFLNLEAALQVTRQIKALNPLEPTLIDFGALRFVQPFSMLYFCAQLRGYQRNSHPAPLEFQNYEELGYPAHMGFFRACGIEYGKDLGEAPGSLHYLPITRLAIDALETEASDLYEDARETIERRSGELATVLSRTEQGDLHETITYALREIFRNVFEHSKAEAIIYAAQYWPDRKMVELAIFDEGDGIASSLKRNPHLTIHSDQDALKLAILPGISGVAFKGARQKRNDAWANSGYGLFMTSQLCQKGGSFVIASGNSLLLMEQDRETTEAIDLKGTAIRLRFKTDQIENLSRALEDLRKRGSQIAGDLSTEANLSASMSSRMLMLDEKQ